MSSQQKDKENAFPSKFIIYPPEHPFDEEIANVKDATPEDFNAIGELTVVELSYISLLKKSFSERLRESMWEKYHVESKIQVDMGSETRRFDTWMAELDNKQQKEFERKEKQKAHASKSVKYILEAGLASKKRDQYLLFLRETLSEQIRHRMWNHYLQSVHHSIEDDNSFFPFEAWSALDEKSKIEIEHMAQVEEMQTHQVRYVQLWITNRLREIGFIPETDFKAERNTSLGTCRVDCTREVSHYLASILRSAPEISRHIDLLTQQQVSQKPKTPRAAPPKILET